MCVGTRRQRQSRASPRARPTAVACLIGAALAIGAVSTTSARAPERSSRLGAAGTPAEGQIAPATARTRADTLWIFDADFEDMAMPDNQGWVSLDRSGVPPSVNYWH